MSSLVTLSAPRSHSMKLTAEELHQYQIPPHDILVSTGARKIGHQTISKKADKNHRDVGGGAYGTEESNQAFTPKSPEKSTPVPSVLPTQSTLLLCLNGSPGSSFISSSIFFIHGT